MSETDRKWPRVVKIGVPGGFCAGVERSVEGSRNFMDAHQGEVVHIVGNVAHNPRVNQEFLDRGGVFVESIQDVPDDKPVIFGPHGHTQADEERASLMSLNKPELLETQSVGRDYMFTECPLVTKVKKEIIKNTEDGFITIYFGQLSEKRDKNGLRIRHPETRAAMSAGNVRLVATLEEALSDDLFDQIENPEKVAFATQTTHNADEALEMADALRKMFPNLRIPQKEDLCFATRNRQQVAKSFQPEVVVIVGDTKTSSNTQSLVKTVEQKGVRAYAVNNGSDLDPAFFEGVESVGIEASASAPAEAIDEVKDFFTSRGSVVEEFNIYDAKGNIIDESSTHFKAPTTHSSFVPQFVWSDPDRF